MATSVSPRDPAMGLVSGPRKKPPIGDVAHGVATAPAPARIPTVAGPNAPGTQGGSVPVTSSPVAPAPLAGPTAPPAPAPSAPGAPLVNTAPTNQGLADLANDYRDRYKQSQGSENAEDSRLTSLYDQYQSRLSADPTKRAIGRATLANSDIAAGQAANYAEKAAAMGTSGTGAAQDVADRANEAARRRSSAAAADISLGREGQLDALTLGGLGIAGAQSSLNLARAGQTNSLFGGAANALGAASAQNLAERQFGLNQYQTQAQIDLARQQQELARQAQQEQAYRNALSAIPASGVYAPASSGSSYGQYWQNATLGI